MKKKEIEEFLNGLDIDIDILNYIDINKIDYNEPYLSIYEMIEENGGFNIEIIYYHNAIKYLSENDPSLVESLEIAADNNYEIENLNSELLASLLASQNIREEFSNLEDKINNFFTDNK